MLYIEGITDYITGPSSSLFPAPIHFPMWLQRSFLWRGGELTLNITMQLVLAREMRQHGNFKAGPQKTLYVSTCLLIALPSPWGHVNPGLLVQGGWETHGTDVPSFYADHTQKREYEWINCYEKTRENLFTGDWDWCIYENLQQFINMQS